MEKLIIEEDIALLQHRLTSTTAQHQSTSKLIHRMTDDMDMMLKGLNDTVAITPTACLLSNDMERLRTLKKDIIDQAIATCSKMRDNLNLIIEIEENKFSVQNRYMESTSQWQKSVFNAIENRLLNMIQRANFMIKHTADITKYTKRHSERNHLTA